MFNTPSHHRVHHASDRDYLDKNYAGILIVWDRLFASYAEETHRPTYGLTKNIDSYNVLTLQYFEYGAIVRDVRSADDLRTRLGFVFGPPGWAPGRSQCGRAAARGALSVHGYWRGVASLARRFAGRAGGIGVEGQRRGPLHMAGGASTA